MIWRMVSILVMRSRASGWRVPLVAILHDFGPSSWLMKLQRSSRTGLSAAFWLISRWQSRAVKVLPFTVVVRHLQPKVPSVSVHWPTSRQVHLRAIPPSPFFALLKCFHGVSPCGFTLFAYTPFETTGQPHHHRQFRLTVNTHPLSWLWGW